MLTERAIETRYQGRPCCSRLEARWAVFFDALVVARPAARGNSVPIGHPNSDMAAFCPPFCPSVNNDP